MALYFRTPDPNNLLEKIKEAIDSDLISAWSYDKDGDFTHTSDKWRFKAWLQPRIRGKTLDLFVLAPTKTLISREVYAVYHARFVESVLSFFDDLVENATATAMPEGRDQVQSD